MARALIEPGSEMYGHYFRPICQSVENNKAVARFSDTELTCGHQRTKEDELISFIPWRMIDGESCDIYFFRLTYYLQT